MSRTSRSNLGNRSLRPQGAAPSEGARRLFCFERLEERTVLSANAMGALLDAVSGPDTVEEGSAYRLELTPSSSIVGWTVDWGDGVVDSIGAGAEFAEHVYADGASAYTIMATAMEALDGNVFEWSVEDGGNGHFYVESNDRAGWLDVEAEAVSFGGHLASITSQEEMDFLIDSFLSGPTRVFWIGLTDQETEGEFRWSSGEELTYTNWNPGAPDDFRGVEDYVAINWHVATGPTRGVDDGVVGDWNDTPLDGINGRLDGDAHWFGIVEFDFMPTNDTEHQIQVTVENVAPTAELSGVDAAVRSQPLNFSFSAEDVSLVDQAAGFLYSIDWDGDGTIDEAFEGGSAIEVEHSFGRSGEYQVRVTATDKDSGVSEVAMHTVVVTNVLLRQDPADSSRTVLLVGGTDENDLIFVTKSGRDGVRVWMNGVKEGRFSGVDAIEVFGGAGDDIIVAAGVKQPTIQVGGAGSNVLVGGRSADRLDGGAGADMLFGGRRNDTLLGGAGNDWLLGGGGRDLLLGGVGADRLNGGRGRDLLVGGFGADQLSGGKGRDLIIGGATAFDDRVDALEAITAEGTAKRKRDVRRANLADGTGSENSRNGLFHLNDETLLVDNSVDRLWGDSRRDLVFLGSSAT